jgi:50S ribosomal protein L16 3-hydroxylase
LAFDGLVANPQTRLNISGDYLFCNGALLSFLDKKSDAYESWLLFAHQRGFFPRQCRRFLSSPIQCLSLFMKAISMDGLN